MKLRCLSRPALARHRRIAAVPFTLRNLKEDLPDLGSNFDGAPDLEFRLATEALELEQSGLGYQRVPPGYRFPYGHTHKKQEEVYLVVRGSGRMSSTTRSSSSRSGMWCASRPVRGGATRPGRRASRSSSSARPISAMLGAKTSRAGATGGLTANDYRGFRQRGRPSAQTRHASVADNQDRSPCGVAVSNMPPLRGLSGMPADSGSRFAYRARYCDVA